MWKICAQGWLKNAEQVVSPNCGPRPDPYDVSLLVIHNISLPPGQFGGGYIEQFFQNRLIVAEHPYFAEIAELQVSSHLLIERSGRVVQFVPFVKRAWHAGVSEFNGRKNCNDFSIGIELEGTDDQPYTRIQYQRLAEITRQLFLTYPNLNTERIVGHCDIAPGRKTDPGSAFDWDYYYKLLDA